MADSFVPDEQDSFKEEKPPQDYWERVKGNLASSLKRFVQNQPGPTSQPAAEAGAPTKTLRNPFNGKTVEMQAMPHPNPPQEVLDVAHSIAKTITDFPEAFAEDPVGTIALPLQILHGGKTAVKSGVVEAAKAGVKAGGKDIAIGAGKTATGGALMKAGGLGESIGGYELAKSGVRQLTTGARAGYDAAKQAFDERAAKIAVDRAASAGAGPMPAQPPSIAPRSIPAQPEPITPAPGIPMMPVRPVAIDTRMPVEPKQTPQAAAQALAEETGQTGTIPFSKPAYVKRNEAAGAASLEPEGFKANARDIRATTAKKMAAHLKDKGITPDTPPSQIADAINASGIELPKTPQARMNLYGETMFELRKTAK